jgi:hypothetical protein
MTWITHVSGGQLAESFQSQMWQSCAAAGGVMLLVPSALHGLTF